MKRKVNNMKTRISKNLIISLAIMVVIATGTFFGVAKLITKSKNSEIKSETVNLKAVNSQIMVEGFVRSQNEASLHFQTGGKVVYLPFKEGTTVKQGQTIASLDTYTIQKQLEAAMNNYDAANAAYKQTKANANDKVLKSQLVYPYDYYQIAGIKGDEKADAIQTAVDHLRQQSKDNVNNAAIQIELAQYALTLASINAPFNGVITHEDINTPYVMATPSTTFNIIDPKALVFRVNISEDEINYVSGGAKATIKLNGMQDQTFDGTVIKIYPDKLSLPNGENVYQVDIASDQIPTLGKYKQGGVAFITNIYDKQVFLAPTWLILNGQNIWVEENGSAVLKQVVIGNVNGAYTEIVSGLNANDKIIVDPSTIVSKKYLVL